MQFVLCRVSRAYLGLSVRKQRVKKKDVDLECDFGWVRLIKWLVFLIFFH